MSNRFCFAYGDYDCIIVEGTSQKPGKKKKSLIAPKIQSLGVLARSLVDPVVHWVRPAIKEEPLNLLEALPLMLFHQAATSFQSTNNRV